MHSYSYKQMFLLAAIRNCEVTVGRGEEIFKKLILFFVFFLSVLNDAVVMFVLFFS